MTKVYAFLRNQLININSMKTKFYYFILAVISAVLLIGCQEKEMPWEKAQKDVNGTNWSAIGEDSEHTIYNLSFSNGKYTLKYTSMSGSGTATGSFTQNGSKIKFEKKMMVTYGFFFVEEGDIKSNKMSIPLYNDNYFSDREYKETLEFILLIE